MADSKAGKGKGQDKPGVSYYVRMSESLHKLMGTCQNNIGANLKGLPWDMGFLWDMGHGISRVI